MKIAFNNMTLDVNIFNQNSTLDDTEELNMIDLCVAQIFRREEANNTLLKYLTTFDPLSDDDPAYVKMAHQLDNGKVHAIPLATTLVRTSQVPPPVPLSTPPPLTLKPLPESMKYAFLGNEETLPVIISFTLEHDQEQRLI